MWILWLICRSRNSARLDVPENAPVESDDEGWAMYGHGADSEDDEPLQA